MLSLTAKDVRGVIVLNPTPSNDKAADLEAPSSVDLDRSREMFQKLMQGGIKGFGLCGTTGEGASLTWDERTEYIAAAVENIRKKAFIFAGIMALGTREAIMEMKHVQRLGADGAYMGIPMWQTPTVENSVQFYADLAEAVPDFPIMISSHQGVFKSDFPIEFWEGVGKKAITVVANQVSYVSLDLDADMAAATDRVRFVPGRWGAYEIWKHVGPKIQALWSNDPCPEPYVALLDAMAKNEEGRAEEIYKEFKSLPPRNPTQTRGAPGDFYMYNVQMDREIWNVSDYFHVGPPRPPYYDLPDTWKQAAGVYCKALDQLRARHERARS